MKNLKLIMLAMLATALVFTSCGTDEEDAAAPTVSFAGEFGSSYDFDLKEISKTLDVIVKLSAEAEIKTFTIKEIKSGLANTEANYDVEGTKEFKGKTSGTYNFSKVVTAANFFNAAGEIFNKIEYVFTIIDKDGTKGSKTFTINRVTETTPPFATEKNGEIFNLFGDNTELGAWDLVADIAKASSDNASDKDMINTTETAADFKAGWKATNGTMFVKTVMPYDSFTLKSAQAVYATGTPAATVSDVAKDDVYVAKLRGEDNYVVIKITNVVTTSETGNNSDKIEFTYKKK